RELYCDFTRQYYPTGQEILVSGQPSKGYFYSSFFALLLAPFGRMALEPALAWWSVVQLVSLLLLLIPAADFYHKSRAAALLYVALLAFSMPVLHNLKWGQVSTLMTGCVFAALYLNARGRWRGAAVVLGFAAAIKYYVAVFAWVHLVRRAWRFLLLLAVVVAVCWLVLPVSVLGPGGSVAFYQTVSERMAHALATWLPEDINSQYLPSVAGRWLGTTSVRTVWQFA
ncbi:MAG TPA: glycosyltransferase family 87 protein, partial [Promineifilum sp.]|nr:glycosyltransferase family 87 protein [Promineifilum sp.]